MHRFNLNSMERLSNTLKRFHSDLENVLEYYNDLFLYVTL